MILGLLLRSDELLLTIRTSDDSWEFRRCDLNWTESKESSGPGYIWDQVDDDLRKAYMDADALVVALPAAQCLVKKTVIEKKLEDQDPGYRKWRAGIELPGEASLFGYGYIPSTEASNDGKPEMIFFAVPADYLRRLTDAVIGENDSREMQFIPEQIGLAELAVKSAGDYHQVALVHTYRQGAVVVILRDGRFHKARYFQIGEGNLDEISVDIETFLLSVTRPDEAMPLIETGAAGGLESAWSPVVPAFLDKRHLDFWSVWGITEFVSRGRRCELQAAN